MFIAGIEPESQGESYPKDLESGLLRNYPGMEGIAMPVRQAKNYHCHDREEDEDLERSCDLADHLDSANVDPSQQGNQCEREQVVLPPGHRWMVVSKIVGE